jgi:N utilization substance protein A
MEMGQLTREQVDHIIGQADLKAEEAEQAAAAERRRLKEQERIEKATAEAEALEKAREESLASESATDSESVEGTVEVGETPDTLDTSEASAEETAATRVEQEDPIEAAEPDVADAREQPSPPVSDGGPPDDTTLERES